MAVKFNYKTAGQRLEVDWPVAVNVPQDGGSVQVQEFTARFKLLKDTESDELQAKAATGEDPYAWINGFWVGLAKSEGEELTDELRAEMLSMTHVRTALATAYYRCAQGQAATKN